MRFGQIRFAVPNSRLYVRQGSWSDEVAEDLKPKPCEWRKRLDRFWDIEAAAQVRIDMGVAIVTRVTVLACHNHHDFATRASATRLWHGLQHRSPPYAARCKAKDSRVLGYSYSV